MSIEGALSDLCSECLEVDEYSVAECCCHRCFEWFCVACMADHECEGER